MVKILITGNSIFQSNNLIKDFIFELSKRYNKDEVVIATFASDYGVEKFVRKYALEFNVNYGEFNPYHCEQKMYEIMPAHLFNKKYHKRNFVIRDSFAIKWATMLIFCLGQSNGNYIINEANQKKINLAKKHNKIIKYIKE